MVLETLEGPAADSNLWAEIGNEQQRVPILTASCQ